MQLAARGTPSLRSISPSWMVHGGYSLRVEVLVELRGSELQFTLRRRYAARFEEREALPTGPNKHTRISQLRRETQHATWASTQLLKNKGRRFSRLPNIPLTSQNNLSTVLLFAQCFSIID